MNETDTEAPTAVSVSLSLSLRFITFPQLLLSCQFICACSPPPATTPAAVHTSSSAKHNLALRHSPTVPACWLRPRPYDPGQAALLGLNLLPELWPDLCRLFFSLVLLFGTSICYIFCNVGGYSFYLTISWVVLSKLLTHPGGKTHSPKTAGMVAATLSAGEVLIKPGAQTLLRPENSIWFHYWHKCIINGYN